MIGKFAVVDKSPDNAARVNVSRNAFFSSRFLKRKNGFFDVDIVVKNESKCGLAWSVLLSTTKRVITVVKMLWTHEAQQQLNVATYVFTARQG